MLLKKIVEALVFASQKPLPVKEIVVALRTAVEDSDEDFVRDIAKTKEPEVTAILEELRADYVQANTSFQLQEQINGWAIVTRPEYALWVRQLYPESKPTRLSGPALETLAIVAYRQPITRADIEAVRGVAVDGVMQSLLDRSLVRIAGRAEIPGRPLLYETTQVFMEHFGLRNLNELPNSDELRRVHLPTAPPSEAAKKASAKAETNPELPITPETPGADAAEPAPPVATLPEEPISEPVAPAPEPAPEPDASPSAEPAAPDEPNPEPTESETPPSHHAAD